ncbi:MAG: BsuPI-related putative proteinase inhibitor [Anaerobacillus sp.]|uniref:BsuPI-related putative proteinase inhibitor n=1 Tax=Anaerobacillus sp. TaxID=1872506 RepID=UPI00391C02DC
MKRYWKVLSSIAVAALLMTACGTADIKEKEVVGGSPDTGYEEPVDKEVTVIEEDAIAVELIAKENGSKYLFKLVNTTEKDIELTFSSLQEFDFIIKAQDGTKVYQYSDEMMFGEAFVEKTLAANGELVFDVDLTEVIPMLESGMYSLEIWSSARESDGLRTEIEIVTDKDSKAGVKTETATLNGLIDSNSVEMTDAAGNITVYRLTDEVKVYINDIPEEEPVIINFYEDNGQFFITSIIVD